MPIRRAALVALLTLLLVPPARGQEPAAPVPPSAGAGRQPAASALESTLPRRCGVCHLDKAPAGTPGRIAFRPPGGQSGAGDAGMCYSCHNGIVVDDRRAHWSGRHHPVAGKVNCGSCHTPHVQAPNVRPFMRYPQGSYAFCACVPPGPAPRGFGRAPGGRRGEGPAAGLRRLPHGAPGAGRRFDPRRQRGEPLRALPRRQPSRDGRGPGMATHVTGKKGPPCLGCHDVHKTVGGKMMLDKAALDGRLCRQCHERNFSAGEGEANHPFAPDRAGCFSCHRMHNAEKPGARRGLLAAAWTETDTICRRCHADVAAPAAGAADLWNHPLAVSIAGNEQVLAARLVKAGAYFAPGGGSPASPATARTRAGSARRSW